EWMVAGLLGLIIFRQTTNLVWGLLAAASYVILAGFYQGQFVLTEVFVNLLSVVGLVVVMEKQSTDRSQELGEGDKHTPASQATPLPPEAGRQEGNKAGGSLGEFA